MKTLKGFEVGHDVSKIPDDILLGIDRDVISIMMETMSCIKYNKWKLDRLRLVLRERNENNDYKSDSQARINFTIKSIEHTQAILDRYEETDKQRGKSDT
jgi:hypothetical protein